MKKLKTLLAAAFFIAGSLYHTALYAQAPQKFSYQTVVRNASQGLLQNQSCGIKISIRSGSAAGTVVYSETQTKTSNINGLVTLEIGAGNVVTGTISAINWDANTYYVQTQIDPTGGTNYTIHGTSQLLSVPYALNAANGNWNINGGNIFNGNTGNVGIGTSSPGTKLDVIGNFGVKADVNQSFYIPGWPGFGNNYIAGVFEGIGATNLGPQVRFVTNTGANFTDIGMDGALNFIIEQNDVERFKVSNNGYVNMCTPLDNSSGNAAIGGPSYNNVKLNIESNQDWGVYIEAPNAANYALQINGEAAKPGGSSWVVASDERLKTSIQPYNDGLSKLLAIKPVRFHYKEQSGFNSNKEHIGVIAQQLQQVAPYMVGNFTNRKDNNEYLEVDNTAMTYMLINAVKEQQVQIEELKIMVNKLSK
jgi:hypothetical protein